ncbi:MAG TPA: hypothetical protein VHD36_00575 [Pirellulales bacterium]|nr:hypothetical protein [Pirellulales bacterium]
MAQPRAVLRDVDSAQCLIVATDDARRDNLGFAAREGGWDVTSCGDVGSAVTHARQRSLQMAIVDISGSASADRASFRFLVEQLACTSRMLLLVCGNLDDPREEVWARHLGVWMYLPGAIDGTELVGLCVAARETVERLAAVNRQQRPAHDMKF